jgi:hypothetical protein
LCLGSLFFPFPVCLCVQGPGALHLSLYPTNPIHLIRAFFIATTSPVDFLKKRKSKISSCLLIKLLKINTSQPLKPPKSINENGSHSA